VTPKQAERALVAIGKRLQANKDDEARLLTEVEDTVYEARAAGVEWAAIPGLLGKSRSGCLAYYARAKARREAATA